MVAVPNGVAGVPRWHGGCWSGVMVAASWWVFLMVWRVLVMRGGCQLTWWPFLDVVAGVGQAWRCRSCVVGVPRCRDGVGQCGGCQLTWWAFLDGVVGVGQVWRLSVAWWPFLDAVVAVGQV